MLPEAEVQSQHCRKYRCNIVEYTVVVWNYEDCAITCPAAIPTLEHITTPQHNGVLQAQMKLEYRNFWLVTLRSSDVSDTMLSEIRLGPNSVGNPVYKSVSWTEFAHEIP